MVCSTTDRHCRSRAAGQVCHVLYVGRAKFAVVRGNSARPGTTTREQQTESPHSNRSALVRGDRRRHHDCCRRNCCCAYAAVEDEESREAKYLHADQLRLCGLLVCLGGEEREIVSESVTTTGWFWSSCFYQSIMSETVHFSNTKNNSGKKPNTFCVCTQNVFGFFTFQKYLYSVFALFFKGCML
eukprot:SAG11_NODE_145_length_14811_cov_24.558931_4_plen_185_part_00